jgi:hypothetical protein
MDHRERTGTQFDEIGAEPLADSGFESEQSEKNFGEAGREKSEDLRR